MTMEDHNTDNTRSRSFPPAAPRRAAPAGVSPSDNRGGQPGARPEVTSAPSAATPSSQVATGKLGIVWFPVDKIDFTKYARKIFDEAAVDQLLLALRENCRRLNRYLTLQLQANDRAEVVTGSLLARAARKSGLARVPARFVTCSDIEARRRALADNELCTTVHQIERAERVQVLVEIDHVPEIEVAQDLRCSDREIRYLLELAKAPHALKQLAIATTLPGGKVVLTREKILLLARLHDDPDTMMALAHRAAEPKVSGDEVEFWVNETLSRLNAVAAPMAPGELDSSPESSPEDNGSTTTPTPASTTAAPKRSHPHSRGVSALSAKAAIAARLVAYRAFQRLERTFTTPSPGLESPDHLEWMKALRVGLRALAGMAQWLGADFGAEAASCVTTTPSAE